jgi:hypothetical protein
MPCATQPQSDQDLVLPSGRRSSPIPLLALASCLTFAACAHGSVSETSSPTAAPSARLPPSTTLTIQGIRFKLARGEPIVKLTVSIDGYQTKTCELESTEGDACLEQARIEPGPHTIEVAVLVQNPETLSTLSCPRADGRPGSGSCLYRWSTKLTAGIGEQLVIDLSKAFEKDDPRLLSQPQRRTRPRRRRLRRTAAGLRRRSELYASRAPGRACIGQAHQGRLRRRCARKPECQQLTRNRRADPFLPRHRPLLFTIRAERARPRRHSTHVHQQLGCAFLATGDDREQLLALGARHVGRN